MFNKQVVALCLTLIAALLLIACGQESDAPPQNDLLAEGIQVTGVPRTTICHYTGIETLPYVEIEISDEAVETHQGHTGDLIPAPAEGCPDTAAITAAPSEGASTSPMPQATPAASGAVIGQATAITHCNLAEQLRSALGASRFVEMLDAEGLLTALAGQSITIFVPTDDAYDQVDVELQNEWAGSMQARNSMLLYHVAAGQNSAAALAESRRILAVSGESIGVMQDDNGILLNESARVVQADVAACEALIHVIDRVLIPPIFSHEMPAPTNPPPPTDRPTDPPSGNSTGGSSTSGSTTGGSSGGSTTGGSTTTGSTTGGSSTGSTTSGSTSGGSTGGSTTGGTTGGSAPTPTAPPTPVPTTQPTSAPTKVPTIQPTSVPTEVPTTQPTSVPTAVPTSPPTLVPTDPPDDDAEVVMCHKPGPGQKTIVVDENEVAGHLGHGDHLGACQ